MKMRRREFIGTASALAAGLAVPRALRAQDRGTATARYMMAAVLAVLTLGTAIGVFGAVMGMWLPRLT